MGEKWHLLKEKQSLLAYITIVQLGLPFEIMITGIPCSPKCQNGMLNIHPCRPPPPPPQPLASPQTAGSWAARVDYALSRCQHHLLIE